MSDDVQALSPRELRQRAEAALRGLAHLADEVERLGEARGQLRATMALAATARQALRTLGSFLPQIGRGDLNAAQRFQDLYSGTMEALNDVKRDFGKLTDDEPVFYREWLFWARTFFGTDEFGDGPHLGDGSGVLVPSPGTKVVGFLGVLGVLLAWLYGRMRK